MSDEFTDEDAVETYRQQMQDTLDRAAEIYREGKQPADFFAKEKAEGRGASVMVTVVAADLREVGSFLLDFPKDFDVTPFNYARKHWVYECLSNKAYYVLSFTSRAQLQRRGYVTRSALLPNPSN